MFEDLIFRISGARKNKLPFVVYRDPGSQKIKGLFQKDDQLNYLDDFKEQGFVFAPFDDVAPTIIFKKYNCDHFELDYEKELLVDSLPKKTLANTSNSPVDHQQAKRDHLALVNKGLDFLKDQNVSKVVLSRNEEVDLKGLELSEIFLRLVQNYPLAFVYLWVHPQVGCWMGASPETLLEVKNKQFKTMALAGTQSFQGNLDVTWGSKEIQEQQFVTDFIESQLNDFDLEISKPFTKKAGSLLHICTEIKGVLADDDQLGRLVGVLHPTPAVCGLPKDRAMAFILENETYDRAFYTGYLGELHIGNGSNLYVNLRCMQIKDHKAVLYIGGGITAHSIAESEWEETVAKSKVMKEVFM